VLAEQLPADFDNVLLIEFDGENEDQCRRSAEAIRRDLVAEGLSRNAHLAVSALEKERFWAVRKAAVPILYRLKGRKKILALVEDAAVPVDQLVPFFRGLYAMFARHGVDFVLYGHIAKGLLHTRPLLDLKYSGDVKLLKMLADDVFDLVGGLDGTVSGEHGDGRLRSAYVKRRYPHIYPLMLQVKALLDPNGMFNPDIITRDDPVQMTTDLRYGAGYADRSLGPDRLRWAPSLEDVVEQCHGCSKCTTVTDDTRMCPVYKATRDESASPKAKANVLRGLISGDMGRRTLFLRGLQQVMDQCVNCGSCYRECPSGVNIPKLAVEAKARYVRRFGAPFKHHLTAHVETVARRLHPLADIMKPLVRSRFICQSAARLTGLAPRRPMVTFARNSFYRQCPGFIPGQGPRVLFFAGCYAAYIRPELALAAVSVFKRMGLQIHVPRQSCCGLPHLTKGLAAAARRKVELNLASWKRLLPEVDYIVVTCSSCGIALMRDWAYLTASDTVRRLQDKVIHVSRLLLDHRHLLTPGPLPVTMAYHQPCHLRLQGAGDSSRQLLTALPEAQVRELGNHCCGMAGSWGALSENFALSKAIGKPMVDHFLQSDADIGVTDCPSCQMQMEHLAGPGGSLLVRHPIEMVWRSLQGY
jgi:Fe-S oxidoreductase